MTENKKPVGNSTDDEKYILQDFIKTLEKNNLKYCVNSEQRLVQVFCGGENFKEQTFAFFFGEDGESVNITVWSIEKFDKRDLPAAYKFCNNLNDTYRWCKFYMDDDDELTCSGDAVLDNRSGTNVIMMLFYRFIYVVDEVCKKIKEYFR